MRYTYKNIGILSVSLMIASCSFSKKQANGNEEQNMKQNVELVVLDPGHFHAALLQKNHCRLSVTLCVCMLPKDRK